jgi:uncharacterized membrane protein YqjE
MDGEAKMNTNGRARDKEPNVTASFAELAHDVIELAELQAKLFGLDVKDATQKTRTSLLLSVVALCVLLGSIPVALMALAYLLIEQLEWSNAVGFGVATLVGLLLSAGILAAGYFKFKSGKSAMQRSREELSRNVAWIKATLRTTPAAARERDEICRGGTSPSPK